MENLDGFGRIWTDFVVKTWMYKRKDFKERKNEISVQFFDIFDELENLSRREEYIPPR